MNNTRRDRSFYYALKRQIKALGKCFIGSIYYGGWNKEQKKAKMKAKCIFMSITNTYFFYVKNTKTRYTVLIPLVTLCATPVSGGYWSYFIETTKYCQFQPFAGATVGARYDHVTMSYVVYLATDHYFCHCKF